MGFTNADLPIHTERLTLRRFRKTDAEYIFALYSNPDIVRYLYTALMAPEGLADSMKRRLKRTKLQREGDILELAAELTATGEFVGAMTFMYRSEAHQGAELGYTVLPEFGGQGYATEGARAMLHIGFDLLGLHRMEAQCDARNAASARVMARIGMRQEAHMRENEFVKGEWTDEILCAMLATEWQELKATGGSPATAAGT
jgi:RimJ/RimL family protein N-acetyltransferase